MPVTLPVAGADNSWAILGPLYAEFISDRYPGEESSVEEHLSVIERMEENSRWNCRVSREECRGPGWKDPSTSCMASIYSAGQKWE